MPPASLPKTLPVPEGWSKVEGGTKPHVGSLFDHPAMKGMPEENKANALELLEMVKSGQHGSPQAALDHPQVAALGLRKPLMAIKNCRAIGKKDMVHNNYMPRIEVDPEDYIVKADGELLTCEPAKVLPMAQRYFLF